jgi:hypothetical protein
VQQPPKRSRRRRRRRSRKKRRKRRRDQNEKALLSPAALVVVEHGDRGPRHRHERRVGEGHHELPRRRGLVAVAVPARTERLGLAKERGQVGPRASAAAAAAVDAASASASAVVPAV